MEEVIRKIPIIFKKLLNLSNYILIFVMNKFFFWFFSLYPIDNNSIVLESEGDCCDNSYALFDFMLNNGYTDRYHIFWLVDHPEDFRDTENITYLQKSIGDSISPETIKHIRTCRWYIYDHCNIMSAFKKRDEQLFVYLSHGWGYKAPKEGTLLNVKSSFDLMTATGPVAAKGLSDYWGSSIEKTKITGYPRLDYFYRDDCDVKIKIEKLLNYKSYSKIIFWMPTFRRSINKNISEDYITTETGLPLFNTFKDLISFNDLLSKMNILVVLKIHHLQEELSVFKYSFSNIRFINDNMLRKDNIQLYQFIKYSDALISDYSSVTIDYLLLDRPIIYILDDYEEYKKSRGLFPENAIDYMPGYHIYSLSDLFNAISDIQSGIDKFHNCRMKVIDDYHKFKDGKSSLRILELIGIK